MKCGTFSAQKNQVWIWKAYCRNTGQLIDRDGWNAYGDIIPSELLVQTKSETYLIESNNAP